MQALLLIVIILLLGFTTYQDFKYRAVSWYIFPLLAIAFIAFNLIETVLIIYLKHILYNFIFLGMQLCLLALYFGIKKVSFKEFFKRFMGLGDLLFFLILALAIEFPTYPLFFVFSLIISLVVSRVLFKNQTIPLAGLQSALVLIFVLCRVYLFPEMGFNPIV